LVGKEGAGVGDKKEGKKTKGLKSMLGLKSSKLVRGKFTPMPSGHTDTRGSQGGQKRLRVEILVDQDYHAPSPFKGKGVSRQGSQ